MRILLWCLVLVLSASPVLAQQHCDDLQIIRTLSDPVRIVRCDTGPVEIAEDQFRQTHRVKQGVRTTQYCTDGSLNPPMVSELRYNTPSGHPEPCDVFTGRRGVTVQTVAAAGGTVGIVYPNGDEFDIDTSVHVPVFVGFDLRYFVPPLPGLTVTGEP
jgi:hypothetical protein